MEENGSCCGGGERKSWGGKSMGSPKSMVARGPMVVGQVARGPEARESQILCSEDLDSWRDGGEEVAY